MIHELKCEKESFEAIVQGTKSFEIRKNDRFYEAGDFLALNEITVETVGIRTTDTYTGRCCLVEVVYILDDPARLADGYVCMAIRPCCIGTSADSSLYYSRDVYQVPTYTTVKEKKQ